MTRRSRRTTATVTTTTITIAAANDKKQVFLTPVFFIANYSLKVNNFDGSIFNTAAILNNKSRDIGLTILGASTAPIC